MPPARTSTIILVISDDGGETFGPARDTGVHGQASNLMPLGGDKLLTIHAHREAPVGLMVRRVDVGDGGFAVEEELEPVPAMPTMGSDSADIKKQFASLKFGQPSLLRLAERRHARRLLELREQPVRHQGLQTGALAPRGERRPCRRGWRRWQHAGPEVQSDYDKLRRLPYLYTFNVLNTAALLCTVSTPLALYAAELGVPKDRIGLLGGIMPFAQVLCIAFLPLVMQFSQRITSALAYGGRYLFLLPWLAAPLFLGTPDIVFWILFGSMTLFSISRTIAETALWPWSQEYMPRQVRGRISGITSLLVLPAALLGSLAIQLWLDSRTGIDRFFPVIVIGVTFGLVSAFSLLGLGGGNPRPGSAARPRRHQGDAHPDPRRQFLALPVFVGHAVLRLHRGQPVPRAVLPRTAGHQLRPARPPHCTRTGGRGAGRADRRLVRRSLRHPRHPHHVAGLQVVLLFCLLLVNDRLPGVHVIAGAIFFLFGLLFQSSISVGGIYMLNYVPPAQKENYMTLAYATDGIIGGGVTFLAGMLLNFLEVQPVTLFGAALGSYETLFVLCAVVVVTSALAFAVLKEEGATGVRDFFGQFRRGSPIRALLSIHRYGALTSEERRRELTYGFGGTRSALVKEELIAALSDPSFDVRHEAIQSLGRLPPGPAVIRALESMLTYEGLEELQYAALDVAWAGCGPAKAAHASPSFLDSPNPLLRARAMRTLGEIRDDSLPAAHPHCCARIRRSTAGSPPSPRSASSAIIRASMGCSRSTRSWRATTPACRASRAARWCCSPSPRSSSSRRGFSREWRREEKVVGYRLPPAWSGLAWTVCAACRPPKESEQHSSALIKATALGAAAPARRRKPSSRYPGAEVLRIAASGHAEAPLVLQLPGWHARHRAAASRAADPAVAGAPSGAQRLVYRRSRAQRTSSAPVSPA